MVLFPKPTMLLPSIFALDLVACCISLAMTRLSRRFSSSLIEPRNASADLPVSFVLISAISTLPNQRFNGNLLDGDAEDLERARIGAGVRVFTIARHEHHRLSIIRIAIAKSRNPTAPRQKPTGSSRNVVCRN